MMLQDMGTTLRTEPTRPSDEAKQGGVMAKGHSRPSLQYRYEHYDPVYEI
jgi:hypothetical protein